MVTWVPSRLGLRDPAFHTRHWSDSSKGALEVIAPTAFTEAEAS